MNSSLFLPGCCTRVDRDYPTAAVKRPHPHTTKKHLSLTQCPEDWSMARQTTDAGTYNERNSMNEEAKGASLRLLPRYKKGSARTRHPQGALLTQDRLTPTLWTNSTPVFQPSQCSFVAGNSSILLLARLCGKLFVP